MEKQYIQESLEKEILRMSHFESRFFKGMTIFNEGTPVTGLYLVKTGRIKLGKFDQFGNEVVLDIKKEGDILNLGTVLSMGDGVHFLTATALEPSLIVSVGKGAVYNMIMNKDKSFLVDLIKAQSKALEVMEKKLISSYLHNVERRLRGLFGELIEKFGQYEDGKLRIDVHLHRHVMASMIGTSPETLIRMMSKLKKKKLIEEKEHRLFVLDRDYFFKTA
ncbi:MAG: Crp/Fnr family transcriptional regulator [Deltaproteobacteria bacterium]|nr:MAG: Crp/Fnr family transcriptional regulator [Deltaproteobacteria bacterium]